MPLFGAHLLQVVIYHGGSSCQPSHDARSIFNELHRLAHSDLVTSVEIGCGYRPQKENSKNVKKFFFERVETPEILHSISMKEAKGSKCAT